MNTSPFGKSRLPSLMTAPASCSNCDALRSSVRSWPEPSETGGTNGIPNTSSGTLPRNGSSSLSSSGDGGPSATMSEFWNGETVRV